MFTVHARLALVLSVALSVVARPFTISIGSPGKAATVIDSCVKSNQVALTFDDGPWLYNHDILNTLEKAGAKGTFFFNGNNYGCIYDDNLANSVKEAYDRGHQIGSHTWAHKDLATLNADQINSEMQLVEKAFVLITGAMPATMRPPFGSINDLVTQISEQRGQAVILWDLDSEDSLGAPPEKSKQIYADKIAEKPANILALNHETLNTTAYDVLPYAINALKTAGYQLVTVSECTGLPPYQFVTSPSPRNASWVC